MVMSGTVNDDPFDASLLKFCISLEGLKVRILFFIVFEVYLNLSSPEYSRLHWHGYFPPDHDLTRGAHCAPLLRLYKWWRQSTRGGISLDLNPESSILHNFLCMALHLER